MKRWILVALVALAAVVRAPLLTRQGLWVDEIFSLAMSTGHSLEHPAEEADPALGDFVESAGARSAEEWRAYLRHGEEPAGPGRVLRAVRLSDTSPPLYYLVLWAWTRVLGTSDLALRGLSLALGLGAFPFLLALARRMGGRRAVLPAGLFLALSPPAVYYGTEGRMYSLLWLCVLACAWATLRLRFRPDRTSYAVFAASAAAGFLTHYFFLFVFVPLCAWLWWRPGRAGRARFAGAIGLVVLALLPWYLQVPESLAAWRITGDWLTWKPHDFRRGSAWLELALGYLTGGARDLWGGHRAARLLALASFAWLAVVWLVRTRARGVAGAPLLLLLWLAGALAGPLVFDLARGTYTVDVPRYAAAGLPAALLLASVLLARLPRAWRFGLVGLVLLAWTPNLKFIFEHASRSWCPLREVARGLEPNSDAQHVVIVHSIPSGVLGIARYYRGEAPLAAWVEQLGQRSVPASLDELAAGRSMVHLVRIHEVGAPAPLEDRLRAEAELVWEGRRESAAITHFCPLGRPRF
ncbi:MAG: glycosyltransferase family 39 protein [Planctomycetota bacterium]